MRNCAPPDACGPGRGRSRRPSAAGLSKGRLVPDLRLGRNPHFGLEEDEPAGLMIRRAGVAKSSPPPLINLAR